MNIDKTKISALLLVTFVTLLSFVVTSPMTMANVIEGGGTPPPSGTRLYADPYEGIFKDLDGDLTGNIYTSGSCNFRIAPNGEASISTFVWVYEWDETSTHTASFEYDRQWNVKAYGDAYVVSWSIVLVRMSDAETLLWQNGNIVHKDDPYPIDPYLATSTGSQTEWLRDNLGRSTTTLHSGNTYQVRYTIHIHLTEAYGGYGYLHRTTSSSSNAYCNVQIFEH